jgi:hypothetical protein
MKYLLFIFLLTIGLTACSEATDPRTLEIEPEPLTLMEALVGVGQEQGIWQVVNGPSIEAEYLFEKPNQAFSWSSPASGIDWWQEGYVWVLSADTVTVYGYPDPVRFAKWHVRNWDNDEATVQPYGPGDIPETPFIMRKVD